MEVVFVETKEVSIYVILVKDGVPCYVGLFCRGKELLKVVGVIGGRRMAGYE